MVPLRGDRHSGLRALSRRYCRNVALRHGTGAVGDAGRGLSGRARGARRLLRRLFPRTAHVQAQARADQGDDRLRDRLSRAR